MNPEHIHTQINEIAQHRDLERIDEAYGEMLHYNESNCNCPECTKQRDLTASRYFEEVAWYDQLYNDQSTLKVKPHIDYDFLDQVTHNYDDE